MSKYVEEPMTPEELKGRLNQIGMSIGELARRIRKLTNNEISRQAVYQWFLEARIPPDRIILIDEATRGRIQSHEINPILYPAPWGFVPKWMGSWHLGDPLTEVLPGEDH